MPTKKKAYKPKPIRKNNLAFILEGGKPPSERTVIRIQAINHSALLAMTRGTAELVDWNTLTVALNTARILAIRFKVGLDYANDLLKAQKAHNNCGIRKLKTGSFGYTGPELSAMRQAMEVVDQQMLIATVAEFEKAQLEVDRLILNKKIELSPTRCNEILEIEHV